MSSESHITVRGLRFQYGRDVSFTLAVDEWQLQRGDRVVCIGPSGSGKTTFLHLLSGILVGDGGSVVTAGVDWAACTEAVRRRERMARLGLVFQEFELLEYLTVRENILLPYYIGGTMTLDGAARARAEELAEQTGIARYLGRKPRSLSVGEQQRVGICRALVTEPAILLADEPTADLDPETTAVVLDLLLEQVRRRGTTLLMVTHNHSLLGSFDRVLSFQSSNGKTSIVEEAG